ncbi:hypothetical protein EV182_000650 [Spiromyces aspiralis]|uniref:Uncharacterized protein n=1 Tax=Spiromyces aspiralis TaxID=68401 RepID=A0ACC1HHT5_9FUNG|nr:hypothetical protein EV182_000650 [Spiromyces aspiralis]
MDGLEARGRLIVIGATNRPNALDPALRRPGRFDREIHIEIPDVDARRAILSHYASRLPLSDEVSIDTIARITNGYVGADLAALCRTAATFTVQRRLRAPSMTSLVTMQDFFDAMKTVPPSVRRGYTVNVAETKWSDIGGMDHVKKKLIQVIEWPIMYGDTIKRLGLRPARGILLYGPPGCSKTTLVKVVATQSNASFFSINGAALYSSYVGDSERIELFHKARASSPAIIFLDEVDTIVGSRDFSGTGSNSGSDGVQERILSTLLNEMDGVEDAKNVLVVGATNRPDMLDPALLRPGRFDRLIYVPPPDETARLEIFKIQTKKAHLAGDIDLEQLARQTELYSGADVANLCKEAAMAALREDRRCTCVTVKPSITREQLGFYTRISTNYEGTGHC